MTHRKIVIIDTVGSLDGLDPFFRDRFPFVDSWGGWEQTAVKGTIPNPHGAMAAEKALQPCWNLGSGFRLSLDFIRIFTSAGVFLPKVYDGWMRTRLLKLAEQCDEMYVNCSWGGYAGRRMPTLDEEQEAEWWKDVIRTTGAFVSWAAGNSGDYSPVNDNDFPQTLLTGVSHKAGSMRRDGRPSDFSSDTRLGPPLGVFWAEDVLLYNGVAGEWDRGSGTSFAAPKMTGLACSLGIGFQGMLDLAKARKTQFERPSRYAGQLPHPKWGYGSAEHLYQEKIEGSPFTWDALEGEGSSLKVGLLKAPRYWFGYNRVA